MHYPCDLLLKAKHSQIQGDYSSVACPHSFSRSADERTSFLVAFFAQVMLAAHGFVILYRFVSSFNLKHSVYFHPPDHFFPSLFCPAQPGSCFHKCCSIRFILYREDIISKLDFFCYLKFISLLRCHLSFCLVLLMFKYGMKHRKHNKNYSVLEDGIQCGFSLKGDIPSKLIYWYCHKYNESNGVALINYVC